MVHCFCRMGHQPTYMNAGSGQLLWNAALPMKPEKMGVAEDMIKPGSSTLRLDALLASLTGESHTALLGSGCKPRLQAAGLLYKR